MEQILDTQSNEIKQKNNFEFVKFSVSIATISIIFGFGFLILLINGYYHINFINLHHNGRTDLIARLGFIAHTIGFFFYPSSIIVLLVANVFFTKTWKNNKISTILFSILGLLVPAILFYGRIFVEIFMGPKEKWIIGLILIVTSFFFMSKID